MSANGKDEQSRTQRKTMNGHFSVAAAARQHPESKCGSSSKRNLTTSDIQDILGEDYDEEPVKTVKSLQRAGSRKHPLNSSSKISTSFYASQSTSPPPPKDVTWTDDDDDFPNRSPILTRHDTTLLEKEEGIKPAKALRLSSKSEKSGFSIDEYLIPDSDDERISNCSRRDRYKSSESKSSSNKKSSNSNVSKSDSLSVNSSSRSSVSPVVVKKEKQRSVSPVEVKKAKQRSVSPTPKKNHKSKTSSSKSTSPPPPPPKIHDKPKASSSSKSTSPPPPSILKKEKPVPITDIVVKKEKDDSDSCTSNGGGPIKEKTSKRDEILQTLTSENLFSHLHEKLSTQQVETSFGDQRFAHLQLLMGFMREDATFLLIMQEMERVKLNPFLLDTKSSHEILDMVLEKIKLAMEVEYQRMKRLWEGSIGLLC